MFHRFHSVYISAHDSQEIFVANAVHAIWRKYSRRSFGECIPVRTSCTIDAASLRLILSWLSSIVSYAQI
jgi:hypothetical protein